MANPSSQFAPSGPRGSGKKNKRKSKGQQQKQQERGNVGSNGGSGSGSNRSQNQARRASPPDNYFPRDRSPPSYRSQSRSDTSTHQDMYRFGGTDSYRPAAPRHPLPQRPNFDHEDQRHSRPDDRHNFSFRSEPAPRQFPPRSGFDPQDRSQNSRPRLQDRRRQDGDRRPFHRRPAPPPTHDRPILHALRVDRQPTPDLLEGMAQLPPRFKDFDEASESESSVEMDLETLDGASDEPPAQKRVKLDGNDGAADEKPKWSNPDPYFALPPVENTGGKKRDVVQLIRKSKVEANSAADTAINAISGNADFVGFDFGDDDEPVRDEGPPIPTGPRADNRFPLQADPGFRGDNRLPLHTDPGSRADNRFLLHTDPARKGVQRGVKRKLEEAAGAVTSEWLPSVASVACPWLTEDIDHSSTEHMGSWLHKEICDFYDYVKPKGYEQVMRQDVVDRISAAVRRAFPGKLYCFGSFAAGLYLPTADMDLVLVTPGFESSGVPAFRPNYKNMLRILKTLARAGIASEHDATTQVISKARVPIIKFVDIKTQLHVDISFENMAGVVANGTFQKWQVQYPAMPVLVCIMKQFLAMRSLNEVHSGGIGGFSITCLVVSFLQHHPDVQSGNMDQERHLGQLLMEFLDFYGNKFNMKATQIRLEPAGYGPKPIEVFKDGRPKDGNKWSIIDPNNPLNDISGGSNKAPLIAEKFSEAFSTLRDHMAYLSKMEISHRKGRSILGQIIGGNYTSFDRQRALLLSLESKRR